MGCLGRGWDFGCFVAVHVVSVAFRDFVFKCCFRLQFLSFEAWGGLCWLSCVVGCQVSGFKFGQAAGDTKYPTMLMILVCGIRNFCCPKNTHQQ